MSTARQHQVLVAFALLLFLSFMSIAAARAQGPAAGPLTSAFTFQGRLDNNGSPAAGAFDFQFRLYDASTGGTLLGTLERPDVPVSDGLFTVLLDFAQYPNGQRRFLDISVRPGAGTGAYTPLSPRQELTAAPYALYSAGNWALSGNAGTDPSTNALGTMDNQPLVFKTNNAEALRINPDGKVGVRAAPSSSSALTVGAGPDAFALQAMGSAKQDRAAGGWVKAEALVFSGYNPIINRCYNSQQAAPNTTPPCGFSATYIATGDYLINFGFDVSDRFYSVIPFWSSGSGVVPVIRDFGGNTVRVQFYTLTSPSVRVDTYFFIVVY